MSTRPRFVLHVLLSLLGGLGVAIATGGPAIVFLGDSLTAGYGLDPEQAFPSLLEGRFQAEKLAYRVVNAGVSGDTTAGGLRRLSWLMRQKPAVVVVALGANDMLRGIDPKETEKNLDLLLTRIRDAGATPVLLGMKATPNLGSRYRDQYDSIFPRLAKKHRVACLEFFIRSVALKPELNQPDGIHPTAEGTKRIAQDVGDFLIPILKGRKP